MDRSRPDHVRHGRHLADIGLVTEDGVNDASARDTHIAGYPILVPMFDIQTIGAGGGSIAYVDEAGAFKVGPRSAGAVPGPACYGLGGPRRRSPTPTWSLGRLDPERFLGGEMRLDPSRRRSPPCERLADRLGIVARSTPPRECPPSPTRTWRRRSARARSRSGRDPRDFTLVAFGGAGPLHAAELADSARVTEVIVPPHPGITSRHRPAHR